MGNFIQSSWHYLSGLAIIAAVCVLAVMGVISGDVAIAVLSSVGSVLIGGGISTAAQSSNKVS